MKPEQLDGALQSLGEPGEVPPIGAELAAALDDLEPVRTRAPGRHLALLAVASLLYLAALLGGWWFRPDLGELPRRWLITYCSAWLIAFASLIALVMLPRRGQVIPRWRMATAWSLIVCAGFVLAGLGLARSVPGVSRIYPATATALITHGAWCLEWGLITALVPVGLGVLLLRGALPVGSLGAAAALGAAGGALGGLFLHLHCSIADALHLGVIHGGVVILAALLAALTVPTYLRAR